MGEGEIIGAAIGARWGECRLSSDPHQSVKTPIRASKTECGDGWSVPRAHWKIAAASLSKP